MAPRGEGRQSPPRFGYEGWLWAAVFSGLVAAAILRWAFLALLPASAWSEIAATASSVILSGLIVGGLTHWLRTRGKDTETHEL